MSVQDNLLMGTFVRDDKAAIVRDLDKMYMLFPRLAERRRQLAGSLSGGEQQMCAMARGLMAGSNPAVDRRDEFGTGARRRGTVDGRAGNDPRGGVDNSIG